MQMGQMVPALWSGDDDDDDDDDTWLWHRNLTDLYSIPPITEKIMQEALHKPPRWLLFWLAAHSWSK